MDISLLTRIGDWLDGIDNVEEKNEAGFNMVDKQRWPSIRGDARQMIRTLGKYKRQIINEFGQDILKKAGLVVSAEQVTNPHTIELSVNPKWGSLNAVLVSYEKLDNERWELYRRAHTDRGFFLVRGVYVLRRPQIPEFLADKVFRDYIQTLKDIGIPVSLQFNREALLETTREKVQQERAIKVDRLEDGRFAIYAPFHRGLVDMMGNKNGKISGITEYNPNTKARETFELPLVDEILEKAREIVNWPIVETESMRWAREEAAEYHERVSKPIPKVMRVLKKGEKLFPYQNEAVLFLQDTDGNALIGDEMGLGKTLETLAYVAAEGKRAVVVCPDVVRLQWLDEAMKFFPSYFRGKTKALSAKDTRKARGFFGDLRGHNLVTINYESFHKFIGHFRKAGFDTLIVDESHRMKNPKAKITNSIQGVRDDYQHHILLSGTAVKNKRVELYTQVDYVYPGLFSSKEELTATTIGGTWNKIRCCYLARTKRTVLPDLPEKISTIVGMDFEDLPDWEPGMQIGDMSRLKDQLAQAKAPQTVKFVQELLASSDSRIVVFTDSIKAARNMQAEIGEQALLHHGQMATVDREAAKTRFMDENAPVRVLVTTRQSMSVGANLQIADKVVFNDLPWTPADVRQAEDRCHRATSKNTVNVYWITAQDNQFDSNVADILRRKYDLTKRINEGKQLSPEEREWMDKSLSPQELMRVLSGKGGSRPRRRKKLAKAG